MTNNMTRDSNGLFTKETETKNLVSPTMHWSKFLRDTNDIYGSVDIELKFLQATSFSAEDGDTHSILKGMSKLESATMVSAREQRVANMIAIATHKEYFNKQTVSTAYNEIADYIATSDSNDDAIVVAMTDADIAAGVEFL